MADTKRDLATLQGLLADNSTGDISEQRQRDVLISLQGSHGTIGVQGNAVATVIPDTVAYVEFAPVTVLGEALSFDQPANGRLRYTGAPGIAVAVTAIVTLQTASANQDIFLRIGKNGVEDAESEQRVKKLVGADNVTVALQLLDQAVLNDFYSVLVRNTTSGSNATAVNLSLIAQTRMV